MAGEDVERVRRRCFDLSERTQVVQATRAPHEAAGSVSLLALMPQQEGAGASSCCISRRRPAGSSPRLPRVLAARGAACSLRCSATMNALPTKRTIAIAAAAILLLSCGSLASAAVLESITVDPPTVHLRPCEVVL